MIENSTAHKMRYDCKNGREFFKNRLLCCLLLLLITFSGYGQTNVVTGTVKDYEREALPGISILEKGTTNGTVTDMNGIA